MTNHANTYGEWTTKDEIDYINRLGEHREIWAIRIEPAVVGRARHIRRYLSLMSLRARWGDVDPDAVRVWCEEELRVLQRIAELVKKVKEG